MVRGAYNRGGASRYNSDTASRGTGVRSWARARVYGMKNNSRLPAGRGRGGPSSNLAISRGRYTNYGNYRGASSYGRGRGGYTNNRGAAMAAYRNNMPRNVVQSYRERLGQRGGRGARGGAFASRRGSLRGGRGGTRGGFRGGRGGRGTRGGRGGRGGAPVNKESLDAELDKYMGDDNIKKRLDNDLENYFSRSGGVGGAPVPGSGAAGPAGDDASRVAAGVVANGTAADAGVASTGVAPRGGMDVSMDNSL